MTGDRSSDEDDLICQGSQSWPIYWSETIAGGRDFQPCPGLGANGRFLWLHAILELVG